MSKVLDEMPLPNFQAADVLLSDLLVETEKWGSKLAAGTRRNLSAEAVDSLLLTKVRFGNPTDRLIHLTEETFKSSGTELSDIYMAKTYYTYRMRVANDERVQVEKWNEQHQSLGEPAGVFRYKDKQEEINSLIQLIRSDQLENPAQARTVGEALFDAVFDNTLRQDFVNFYYHVVLQEKQLLRVELDIDEQKMPAVAALPWEFMCLPASANLGELWIGTDPHLVFSRRRAQWHAAGPIQLESGEKLRIALAIASPTGSSDLGPVVFDKVQAMLEKLASSQSERIELLPIVNPATPEAIDSVLEKHPHIFHFIGHGRLQNQDGEEVGEIALLDDFDEALWVDANFFGGLFNRHRPGVVLMQACEGGMLSASQAFVGVASKMVQQNIPVVLAMQYEVSNATASRFANRFYERLAQDDPVDIAAQNGRRTIALNTQYRKRDFATPVIFIRVQDGYLFKHQEREELETEDLLNKGTNKQRIVHTSGDRSVAIGGTVSNSSIISGDSNLVHWRSPYNAKMGNSKNIDEISKTKDKEPG